MADVEELLDEADRAFAEEDHERALALAGRAARRARAEREPLLEADAVALAAAALNQLGEARAALARADEALRLDPEHAGAPLERAFALFELCRFEEARAAVEGALARAPDDAWGHQLAGLLAERRGDAAEARRRFARARELAPADYPEPPRLSRAAFDAAVEDALAALPEAVRAYLVNVPITVEDLPSDQDLLGADPPLSPAILGLFRGAPWGQKASGDPWSHLPSSIVLFQGNLERFARDRDELVDEIEITLLHEVGHFLGLDEEELARRGLD